MIVVYSPLTMYLLYDRGTVPFPILSSKSEENFLGEICCEAFKQENYFAVGWTTKEKFYRSWWFYPKEMLIKRLEMFK